MRWRKIILELASHLHYALGAPIAEKKLILAWVGRARILAMRIVENDTGAKEIDAEIFP